MITDEQLKEWRKQNNECGVQDHRFGALLNEVERLRTENRKLKCDIAAVTSELNEVVRPDLKTAIETCMQVVGGDAKCFLCSQLAARWPDLKHAPSCLVTRYRALLEGEE